MSRSSVLVCLVCAVFLTTAFAPDASSQAAALVAQSYAALTRGNPVTDVTLNAMLTQTAGSFTATQPVVLKAMGTDDSRIDIVGGYSMEIRNSTPGYPQGVWTAPDGTSGAAALHNCWTDAAWFFPAFSSVFSTTQPVQLTYIGVESWNGASVQHIRITKLITDPSGKTKAKTLALITKLSQMELYLDAQSLLPVAASFAQHPDDDAGLDIPVVVTYSDYRAVSGVQVPFHIQEYVQNNLSLDFVISGATFNSGLTASSFQIQ